MKENQKVQGGKSTQNDEYAKKKDNNKSVMEEKGRQGKNSGADKKLKQKQHSN